jgi:large exoprotein involved in heme utilization and adhesion
VLLQESRIVTDAFSPSGGSNINIQPFNDSNIVIVRSNDSVINAAGNLTIDSSVTFKPAEIPEVAVVNPSDLIAQEFCRQRGSSEFIVTGKGGLAADPNDKADGNQIEVDLVEPVPSRPRNSSQRRSETEDNQPISSLDIVPARGWIRDENGDVILVSYDPTKTGINRQLSQPPQCQPSVDPG